ncbi:MAG: hypothetical protein Q3980_00905 [Turicibacter sp.]|nr:hypothetical protein [Turicibacter sp.]
MIQYISFRLKTSTFKESAIVCSTLDSPRSLDEFDINIIDLNDELLWRNNARTYDTINNICDLDNLNSMIRNSQETNIIILFPQDCEFQYGCDSYGQYVKSIELKNMKYELQKIVGKLINQSSFNLEYENTVTNVENQSIDANFYFNVNAESGLLKSNRSNKVTTMRYREKVIISTLTLDTHDKLMSFIRAVNLIRNVDSIPEWIHEINMFDDREQKETILKHREIIESSEYKISLAEQKIEENNEYKSVLFTNGDQLVNVVFNMLAKLLDYDLSEFEDKKKEDFLIKKDGVTFIGEIKGVTSNVKSEHISQLDVHLQSYLDQLAEQQRSENVKSILIINHQRNKCLAERQPVHENQIKLAHRNNSLIIETITLLNLFEQFVLNKITVNEVSSLFREKVGLLEL